MGRISIGRWLLAVSLALALAAGLVTQAWAQYPPPGGSITVGVDDSTPLTNVAVEIGALILDEDGNPAAGVECTFSVTDQPGDNASVDAGPFTTDDEGIVDTILDTGSTTGAIVVEATCGDLSATVTVEVQGAAAPTATRTGAAPASTPASLPDTGTGDGGAGFNWAFWSILGAGIATGLGGVTIAWRQSRA